MAVKWPTCTESLRECAGRALVGVFFLRRTDGRGIGDVSREPILAKRQEGRWDVLKSGRTVVAVAISLALAYLASGCAGLQRGPSDEDLLGELLRGWQTALDEGNVDNLLSFYSKDYTSEDGTDYEGLADRMEQIVPLLEEYGVEISAADAKIEIERNKATLCPIAFDSSFGSRTMSMEAAKEADGVWRITGTSVGQ